jgi:CBS domain containing-hemolysin-like protein
VTAPTGSVRPEIDPEQQARELDRDVDRSGQLVCRQTGKLPKRERENKYKAKICEKGKRRKKK